MVGFVDERLPSVEVIIFDMMGVIFIEGDDTRSLLIPFIKKECRYHDEEDLLARYLQASLGSITTGQFWAGITDDWVTMQKLYLDTRLELDPDFIPVAEALARNHDLAILSNDLSDWSKYLRQKYSLDRLFREVVVSADYGVRKPDRKLYQILLKRLGVPAQRCVLIDDNIRNLQPAAELGMKTVHFARLKGNHPFRPDFTVRSMRGVLELFGGNLD